MEHGFARLSKGPDAFAANLQAMASRPSQQGSTPDPLECHSRV